jgi:class 3 adenylate cyclase
VILPGILIYIAFSTLFGFFFVFSQEIQKEIKQAKSIVIDLDESHEKPLMIGGQPATASDLPSLGSRAKEQITLALYEIATVFLGLCAAWIYHWPLILFFRSRRRGETPGVRVSQATKFRIWASPVVMASATAIPIVVAVSLQNVALGPGHSEAIMIPIEIAILALSTLFTYLWQRHRVQNRYLVYIFTREELASNMPRGHRLPVRKNFIVVMTIATILPVAVVVLFVGSGVKSIGKFSSLSDENRKLLFGSSVSPLPSFKVEGLPERHMGGIRLDDAQVPMIAPLDTIRIAIGLVFGLSIVLAYVFFITRWTSSDLAKPIEELRENMRRAEAGDLSATTPATAANELGELAVGFNLMLKGIAERGRIKELFGQYLTKEISEAILDGRVNLGGARYEATVMFTDIRGFTAMSERLSPEEVFAFLNDYLGRMIEVIAARGGIIDKFLGDGILAVFGLPVQSSTHADDAFSAALDMRKALAQMNADRAASGRASVKIGIGMHTGEVIAGNVGSAKKLQFTVIGDAVNLASRIEGLNKDYGSYLLLSKATYERLSPEARGSDFEELKSVEIRGKNERVDLYRLRG